MSRNRELQFFSLAGKKETQALHSIQAEELSQIAIHEDFDLITHLKNVIWMALNQGKKLAICLTPDRHQRVLQILNEEGPGTFLFSYSKRRDRAYLSSFLYTHSKPNEADWSGLSRQLYHFGEMCSYREKALNQSALGDKHFKQILSQYVQLSHWDTKHLDRSLDLSNFEFDSKEYWLLRGRIHTGAQIWKPSLQKDSPLSLLHPVFFDMYKPQEAYIVIYEMTRKFKETTSQHIQRLEQWKSDYKSWMADQHSLMLAKLRTELLCVRQNIQEELDRESSQVTTWRPFRKSNTNSIEHILDAYRQLQARMHEIDLPTNLQLDDTSELKLIQTCIERLLDRFGAVKRELKKSGDLHLRRLNKHTIKDNEFRRRFENIWSSIQETLAEINGFQIFKDHIHHHALELSLLEDNLRELLSNWEGVEAELPHLTTHIEWNQFTYNLDTKSQQLLSEISHWEPRQWPEIFEAWYLRHFLECQDLGHMGEQVLKSQWIPIQTTLSDRLGNEWSHRAQSGIEQGVRSFMQSSRDFSHWMTKGREYSTLEQDLDLMVDRIPLVFFENTDKKHLSMWRPDWVFSEEDIPEEYWTGFQRKPNCQICKNDKQASLRYLPSTPKNILHSEHHQRITYIKQIAEYLHHTMESIQVWQNNHSVIIGNLDHEVFRLIQGALETTHTRTSEGSGLSVESWTETLLNNHGRTFEFLHPSNPLPYLGYMAASGGAQFIQFLEHIGMQSHEVSWEHVIRNAKIIRHLGRHDSDSKVFNGKSNLAQSPKSS